MQKLSKKILAEIKKQHLAPRERWVFLAKNYGIWALALIGILLAGIFLGTAIHEFAMEEWEISSHFPGGRTNFLMHAVPFLWLFGIASAFAIAFFLLRQTKKGYRYGILAISGIIFVASVICAVSFLATPLPPKFQAFRLQNFPPDFDAHEWQDPEDGFLFGEIRALEEKALLLDALDDGTWRVDISTAKIPPQFEFVIGKKIRVIGEKTEDQDFKAEFIRPEMPPKMRGMMFEIKVPARAY